MKKVKWYKFDKELSEKQYNEVFILLKDENIKKLKKQSLTEFITWTIEKSQNQLNTNSIIKVFDDLKTGVI